MRKDFLSCPYRPHMSFTATGLDVTSRGGSFGGLIVSLMLRTRDLNQGSGSAANKCERCRSASESVGNPLCTKSAIVNPPALVGIEAAALPFGRLRYPLSYRFWKRATQWPTGYFTTSTSFSSL